LAVVDDAVVDLGWFLVPTMLLGCGIMLVVALLVNNIEPTFPIFIVRVPRFPLLVLSATLARMHA
jgi:hypothetical protein